MICWKRSLLLAFLSGTVSTVDSFLPAAPRRIPAMALKQAQEEYSGMDASAFIYDSYWGFKTVPDSTDKEIYVQALCNSVAADGVASPEEVAWIQGYSAAKGYDTDLLAKIPEMASNSEDKSLDSVIEETVKSVEENEAVKKASRVIIFDAIRASMQDGLAKEEEEAIVKIAGIFGIDKEDTMKLVELAEKEEALKKERLATIFPDGHPYLQK